MKKKAVLVTLKLCVTTLIFYWIVHKLGSKGRADLWASVCAAHPLGLCLGLLAFLGGMVLGICRWQLLLRVQGIRLSAYQATWITGAGIFFNAFLSPRLAMTVMTTRLPAS